MRPVGGTAEQARRHSYPNWFSLFWKAGLFALVFGLLSFENPFLTLFTWSVSNLIATLLVLWVCVVAGVASTNLLDLPHSLRWAWVALFSGTCAALALPAVVRGPNGLEEALGPVVALTLAAHLGRRDLPRALRDWAVLVGVALFLSLGVMSMLAVANSFGEWAFLVAIILPPLTFEVVHLLLSRLGRTGRASVAVALVVATFVSVAVISTTMLNRSTPALWTAIFDLAAGLLIGGALLVTFATRPFMEAASGAYARPGSFNLARALVELSHGPILISLAIYVPLRLLSIAR